MFSWSHINPSNLTNNLFIIDWISYWNSSERNSTLALIQHQKHFGNWTREESMKIGVKQIKQNLQFCLWFIFSFWQREGDILALTGLHVVAEQVLQRCWFDNIKTDLATKSGWFPGVLSGEWIFQHSFDGI